MSIRVTCPACDSSFKARDEYAGKRVKCPGCSQPLEVPDAVEASGDDLAASARPPVKKPPVVAGSVPPPAAVIPPAVAAPAIAAAAVGLPLGGTTTASRVARRPTRAAAPVWVWVTLASLATAMIVGVGVYVATRPGEAGGEVATADNQDAGPSHSQRPPQGSKPTRPAPAKETKPKEKEPEGFGIESDAAGNIKRPKPIVARTMEGVKDAVVKIDIPQPRGGMTIGTGFFINNRGWVATNNHVIKEANSATRVKLADGMECAVKGIVAVAPDHDLAIIALDNPPLRLTVLNIQRQDEPKLGEPVWAMGHPHNLSFSLVSGNVGRVATTRELLADRPNEVLSSMKAPADLVWIQHNAKIDRGDSGGPLADAQGRLLGINTFVNEMFGYAVHVRYLRELAAHASDANIRPLPEFKPSTAGPGPAQPVPPPGATQVSPERLKQLFDACAAFGWKPADQAQYDQLAELAKVMTHAKHAQLDPHSAPGAPPAAIKACAEMADKLFGDMKKAGWTAEHLAAVNKFAGAQLDKTGQGIVAFAPVMGNAPNALLLQVEGSDKRFLVTVSPAVARELPGTRWLVLGLVSGGIARIQDNQGNVSQCRVLASHYMFKIE